MTARYFVGIDVAKEQHRVAVVGSDGEAVGRSFSIPANRTGLEKLLRTLQDRGAIADSTLVGLEASGHLWENMEASLTEKGYLVLVLNPLQLRRYRDLLRTKAKTDDLDAYLIAGLLRSGQAEASYVPEEQIQSLRELARLRARLMRERQDYLRRLQALLVVVFPEHRSLLGDLLSLRARALLKVFPTARHLAQASPQKILQVVQEAGARGFSDDGRPVASARLMRRALEYARVFDLPIIDHCEEPSLVCGGVVHEGEVSARLGLAGWPSVAEEIVVERDALLAEYTGGRVHVAHLSTAGSVERVRRAKGRGVRITCEVTPHHLVLTEEAAAGYDTNVKMNPPLRSEADRQALVEALSDGTVDAIATDHAPHHQDEKAVEFARAPFGVVGLETAVSVCLDRLVRPGHVSLRRLVELFTVGPAGILRLDKGTLRPGADADVTVLDLEREVTVDAARFFSKSSNSPFLGWTLRGVAVLTIVAGRIVHDGR